MAQNMAWCLVSIEKRIDIVLLDKCRLSCLDFSYTETTHCGLVKLYVGIDMGQIGFR